MLFRSIWFFTFMINILIRKVHDFLFSIFERNVSQYNKSNKHSSINCFIGCQRFWDLGYFFKA